MIHMFYRALLLQIKWIYDTSDWPEEPWWEAVNGILSEIIVITELTAAPTLSSIPTRVIPTADINTLGRIKENREMLISKFDTYDIDQKIIDFEEEHKISLPSQYRNFLQKYNGGDTPKTDLYNNGENIDTIPEFYGIGDVASPLRDFLVERFKGRNMLPIASDIFGNQITIGIGKENYGKIFFCDHETGDKPECDWEDLKTFLDCCKSEVVDKTKVRSIEEREAEMIAQGRGDCVTEAMRQSWKKSIEWYNQLNQEEVILDD